MVTKLVAPFITLALLVVASSEGKLPGEKDCRLSGKTYINFVWRGIAVTPNAQMAREVLQYNKTDRKNTLHKWSAFGLSVLNPKPKLSQRANQMKEEIPFRADNIQNVTTASTMAVVNNTESKDGTSTTGTPMTASTKASATATVEPNSTTHDTTKSSSASVKITSLSVTKSSSISTISKASAKAVVNNTASKDGTSTTGTPMTATKKASATAPVQPTSTTHDTTKSSSADVKTTSPSATTSSSMSTIRNASFSIGTGYSSPDCASCSNRGTITVTKSCSIKMPPNDDKKCDKDEFNKTSCGYVTMVDKIYSCADVKKNFTFYEEKYLKSVKQCGDVCPTSGSDYCRLCDPPTLKKLYLPTR
ncbi:A-agglutinin anchorage subunit-like [Pocillopora damicornis]|uniref:A-agglutinin anchorage subunit-like n=1 Tax=Pocillopora damicornis TaxID=46731 RepID=UPI000F5519A4|nr:A-agglutinin anchorage subunit-like [Pocillopora damicornis]